MTAKPHIVVLDGYTLNPGDLGWEELQRLGACEIHDRTPPELIVSRSSRAEIVLTNKTPLSADAIAALPRLKFIAVLATGYNIVDVDAARRRGIPVSNVPTYGTRSVVQATFAHLLNLTFRIDHHSPAIRDGRWSASVDFSFWDHPLPEIAGKTLGIVGLGRIGRAVAAVARAFEMRVLAYDSQPPDAPPEGVELVGLEPLLRTSDFVSLHCPLTPQTERLINAANLALMKPTAYLINTSRGPVIDEPALADALNQGRIAGAGLDVLSVEPPPADNPLLTAKNCVITPHIAWATREARERLLAAVIANVRAFLAGTPQNVVNP